MFSRGWIIGNLVAVLALNATPALALTADIYGYTKAEYVTGSVDVSENTSTLELTGFSSVYSLPLEIYLSQGYDPIGGKMIGVLSPDFKGAASFEMPTGGVDDKDMISFVVPGWSVPVGVGLFRDEGTVFAKSLNEQEKGTDISNKKKDILRLIELTIPRDNLQAMVTVMLGKMKIQLAGAQLPEVFWREMETAYMDADMWYREVYLPIYDRHYNHDEVKALIRLHAEPVMRKAIADQPQMMKEAEALGAVKGKEITERIVNKLKTTGQMK
jgi:hypothetical protein